MTRYVGWDVKLFWKAASPWGGERTYEAGMNTGFPEGLSVLEVIREVAEARNVDLTKVYSAEAEKLGCEWEAP